MQSRNTYHFVRAPFNFNTSHARFFWLVHKQRPSSRASRFNRSTVRRNRFKKSERPSISDGASATMISFRRCHQPSIALRSGEALGKFSIRSKPAAFSASRLRCCHRHLYWSFTKKTRALRPKQERRHLAKCVLTSLLYLAPFMLVVLLVPSLGRTKYSRRPFPKRPQILTGSP